MSNADLAPAPIARTIDRRQSRPEQIDIGDDILIRNDIIAKQYGGTERSINRGDAKGAPFVYVAGVKYRPQKGYRAFIASRIQAKGQAPKRRASR